jgi:hypothetical protein
VPGKLILAVVDAMKPAMLERAVSTGKAPMMAALMQRGHYVDDCVAAFPSVTPVCAASIATGAGPDRHAIPSMNWYHRDEGRYVEYGTSFGASRAFGLRRSLTDTIYNMNAEHLSKATPTVFEQLDDADVRTAGTTYLMYRGRYEHQPAKEAALAKVATQIFRKPVDGPREFFYADLFASRKTGCRATLGMPGVRDQHAGCVGAYLQEHDLYDFLLLSLPDNDTHSHRNGPEAQVATLAEADRQIERVVHAAGGLDAFLRDGAIVVCSDHSQSKVEAECDLFAAFDVIDVLAPGARSADGAQIALCPGSRSAQVYVLDPAQLPEMRDRIIATALREPGVDLVITREEGLGRVVSRHGQLRFRPDGPLTDLRGETWQLDGDPDVLGLSIEGGEVRSATYPDALGRLWSALTCRQAGDVLLSATPGYEFTDWGGSVHLGGGSHGGLDAADSHGALLWAGDGLPAKADRRQWTLRDVTPMCVDWFGSRA